MRKLHIFGIAALSVLALGCSGTGKDSTTQGPGVDKPASSGAASKAGGAQSKDGTHAVIFEVTGDGVGKATSVSYGMGGNTSQANGTALPWKKEATSTDSFLMLSLVAQSGSDGTISCRITVDGKVVVENSSQGQYAVVTCSKAG